MLLPPSDLAALTGYTQPARQIRWLVAHGWRFEVGGDGLPKVLRAYADARLGAPAEKRRGPNLTGLARGTPSHEVA